MNLLRISSSVFVIKNFILGPTYIYFCPYCVNFVRRDAEGWEVIGPDS